MMKVVRNPSRQVEKIDRPVRSVNLYDNDVYTTNAIYMESRVGGHDIPF